MVFIPSESIVKTMIRANLQYADTDSLDDYLLRFGLVQDENELLKQLDEEEKER